ncbi:MAG: SCP2 sterol-binding domain-containing protein [Aeropyrum sp.]|nr:SCP2 sterol-binding domain-containing protein [Aeropyrum sp.]
MAVDFPSEEFARRLCEELNKNERYRRAARGWRWPILFRVEGPQASVGFILDLHEGECRGYKWLEDASHAQADYILAAPLEVWLDVISGKAHPMKALLARRIKLEKGSYSTIARYTIAALEITKSAKKVLEEG